MNAYLTRHRDALALLCTGFLLTFFSSFGQTFYIALSGGEVREAFGLSHGQFGMLYSGVTLVSGLLMIWLGAAADRLPYARYTTAILVLMCVSCLLYASATHIAVMAVALFGVRMAGQGLMGHAAIVGMARAFSNNRGKAISTATLGHPAGEAIFPIAVALTLPLLGWRPLWVITGVLIAIAAVAIRMLVGASGGRADYRGEDAPSSGTAQRSFSRREMLHDLRFYLLMPALAGPSFVGTGVFFHQIALVEFKGWTLPWFAGAFAAYAAASITATIVGGAVVDRIGARTIMPVYLLPLLAACTVLALGDHPLVAYGYMILAGATTGLSATVVATMWVELYGLTHLGAIRAISSALMVLSTALAPGAMGLLIDGGVSLDSILWACAAGLALACILVTVAMRLPPPRSSLFTPPA